MSKKNVKLSERNSIAWKIYKTIEFDLYYLRKDLMFGFLISATFLIFGLLAFLYNQYAIATITLGAYFFIIGFIIGWMLSIRRFKFIKRE